MNKIDKITLENIKGKQKLTLTFEDMHANHPNILVAPNGFGKSTIAVTFKGLQSGKLELKRNDIYLCDETNIPSLRIKLSGDNVGTYCADNTQNTITALADVTVINNPVYAKNTGRNMGSYHTASAELGVEPIILCANVPSNATLNYQFRTLTGSFGAGHQKLFLNLNNVFNNTDNLINIASNKRTLIECIDQIKPKTAILDFLRQCPTEGSADNIKSSIPAATIQIITDNSKLNTILNTVKSLKSLPHDPNNEVDSIFSMLQIIKLFSNIYNESAHTYWNQAIKYKKYKDFKALVDSRLNNFNTTSNTVKTKEDHGKLILDLKLATNISNGERDVLYFVAKLAQFEFNFKKEIGIIIIDEIFDYLDGSNMLAVQYYLTETINNCKKQSKILFPLIFTHLDPTTFGNYYMNKMKIHYLAATPELSLDSDAVKLLKAREDSSLKNTIEKYFIHYEPSDFSMLEIERSVVSATFNGNNTNIRTDYYSEAVNNYLSNTPSSYDPVKIAIALRVKIEELLYTSLQNPNDLKSFIDCHTTKNKLNFAEDKGVEVPEVFHLLQPLYNDSLHLGGPDYAVKQKLKSLYLKLDSLHIKHMIKEVFAISSLQTSA